MLGLSRGGESSLTAKHIISLSGRAAECPLMCDKGLAADTADSCMLQREAGG